MDSHSQSHLTEIPLETLTQISSYLSTHDLGSLRRSCKHVEAALFEPFSREFFTKKQFMLSPYSLQALIDISNHPRLSRCLSHVIVGLDTYETAPPLIFLHNAVQRHWYQTGAADQLTLRNRGRDRDMLAQAFRNLPNLKTVGLRDYHSRARHRDGDNHTWASYGATTIVDDIGIQLIEHQSDDESSHASDVFSAILLALGQSGARPETFEVLLRKRRSGLGDVAFNLPDFDDHFVAPVLSSLKTLLLALEFSHEHNYPTSGYDDDDPCERCPGRLLREYLHRVPNLTHLRLNFLVEESHYAEQLLLWMGLPATQTDFAAYPPPILLPVPALLSNLQRLDLGMLRVTSSVLFPVINKLKPTLRALSFWKVTMMPPDQQAAQDDSTGTWPEFLAQLSDLDYVSLGCLWQVVPGGGRQTVRFKLPAEETSSAREYSGYDMKDFPDNVISDMVVVGN